MTIDEYELMLSNQNYVCAICKKPETRVVRPFNKQSEKEYISRLSIDHNHVTGKNRGLLCTKCNIGIGHLQDNIENLKEAIKYIRKWENQ
jgi:hypothetical protein